MIFPYHTILMLKLLFLISIQLFSQERNFTSDNGFSGTFELVNGNQLKHGSVVIEKLKTSVGVFMNKDLANYGIELPLSCADCNFIFLEKLGPKTNYNIQDQIGKEFLLILEAAKKYVQVAQENKKYKTLIAKITREKDIQERKKLIYNSYYSFYNKERIENLLDSLTVSNTMVQKQLKEKQIEVTTSVLGTTIKSIPKNKHTSKITEDTAVVALTNTYTTNNEVDNLTKHEQKIKKLKIKKAKAQKNNDVVLVNEIEHSIARLQKKSGKKKPEILALVGESMEGSIANSRAPILATTDETIDETIDETKYLKQKNENQIHENSSLKIEMEQRKPSVLMSFKSSETYENCENNLNPLEKNIITVIEADNYEEVKALRKVIKVERKNCKFLKKEFRRINSDLLANNKRRSSRSSRSQVRQIDSPRIFF